MFTSRKFWWQSTYHLIWDEYISNERKCLNFIGSIKIVGHAACIPEQWRNRWAMSVKILSQLCWFRQVYTQWSIWCRPMGENKMKKKRFESSVAMKMMIIQNVSISKSLIFFLYKSPITLLCCAALSIACEHPASRMANGIFHYEHPL